MSLTSRGLTDIGFGAGLTANFQIQYESDTTILPNQANVIANANALLALIENEFTVTTRWFATPLGNFGSGHRQVVNLNLSDGSGANNEGYGQAINLDAQNGNGNAVDAAARVAMLFINEWVEVLMGLTGKWNSGDSSGEGLSQLCGLWRFPAGHYSYYNASDNRLFVKTWANTHPRQDWVTNTEGTDKDSVSFGCALAFLYYLNTQLNFSINEIVAAGSANLATTYLALTGRGDGWTSFIDLVEQHYPEPHNYHPVIENLFPATNLSHFLAPDPITAGYSADTAEIFLDSDPWAEIVVKLTSEHPAIASVPASVTIATGKVSVRIPMKTTKHTVPFEPKSTKIKATYAGRTLEIEVSVVPPRLAGFTIEPANIKFGQQAIAKLALDNASLSGDVHVEIASGVPGFDGIGPSVTIPQGHRSRTFTISPQIPDPSATLYDDIYATYGQTLLATLAIWPPDNIGALYNLVLPRSSVSGGASLYAMVYLTQRVTTDTLVGLLALDAANFGPFFLNSSNRSTIVSVPQSVTIPAGQISAGFSVRTTKLDPSVTSAQAVIMANASVKIFKNLTVTR